MSTTGQRNHITSILVQEDVFVGVFVMFSVHKLQEVNRGECAVRTTATRLLPRTACTKPALSAYKKKGMGFPANLPLSARCVKKLTQRTRPFARRRLKQNATEQRLKRKPSARDHRHLKATRRISPPLSKVLTLLRLARAAS